MSKESVEYLTWLEKFEVKKTSDSCFTPPAVYDAARNWAVNEYQLHGFKIERPFYPSGDYQAAAKDYDDKTVVIDNPPFSIASEIVRFYEERNIKYFLFANHLTLFNPRARCSIIVNETFRYTNGAKINTSFITNLDDNAVRTAPDLKAAIQEADKESEKPPLPRYKYPDNLITAAILGKIATIDFRVPRGQVSELVRQLDSQREADKAIFGGGFLICDKSAEKLKKAERQAEELKASRIDDTQEILEWTLSDRELEIIESLGR